MSAELERVESGFARLAGEYKARKKRSEALVVAWKWSKSGLFDLRPLYAESRGWPSGKVMKTPPTKEQLKLRDHFQTGFDATGRVVVVRQRGRHGTYETFTDWTVHPVEVAHFDYDTEKEPLNLMHVYLADGRPVAAYVAAKYGFDCEKYTWDGDVVVTIKNYHAERKGKSVPKLPLWLTAKATYDSAGELQRVEVTSKGDRTPEVRYERRDGKIFRK